MISIVMSTYNGEKYIVKQLDSLREQTLQPDEVIIRDDCSQDNTAAVVKKYIESHDLKNWIFTVNESNYGYKKNFYEGVKQSRGDIIFLCDQDDEWKKNKLSRMIEIMKKNSEIQALSCGTELIDGKSKLIENALDKNYYNSNFLYLDHKPSEIEYFSLAYLIKHNISPGCSTCFTRKVADAFLDSYDFDLPHDWYINMIAAVVGKCAYIDEPLIRYRRHENNAIGANTSMVMGIKKKTRNVRIDDYKARRTSAVRVLKESNTLIIDDIRESLNLTDRMIDFYEKPNIAKLFRLRRTHEYFELVKKKVRIWEFAVALHVDGIISKMLR